MLEVLLIRSPSSLAVCWGNGGNKIPFYCILCDLAVSQSLDVVACAAAYIGYLTNYGLQLETDSLFVNHRPQGALKCAVVFSDRFASESLDLRG